MERIEDYFYDDNHYLSLMTIASIAQRYDLHGKRRFEIVLHNGTKFETQPMDTNLIKVHKEWLKSILEER